jgi:hypothetical protein
VDRIDLAPGLTAARREFVEQADGTFTGVFDLSNGSVLTVLGVSWVEATNWNSWFI